MCGIFSLEDVLFEVKQVACTPDEDFAVTRIGFPKYFRIELAELLSSNLTVTSYGVIEGDAYSAITPWKHLAPEKIIHFFHNPLLHLWQHITKN